jgi:hypothetical protein
MKASAVTLAATVWLIYAGDRVLDTWHTTEQSARHIFYKRHWRTVVPMLLVAVLLAAWCAFTGIRKPVLRNGIILFFIVATYFGAVHVAPKATQRWWSKEMAVAVIFALGTCIHAWTFGTQPALLWMPPFLLFVALCWINCAAITWWEGGDSHPSTWWLGRHLGMVSAAIAFLLALTNPMPANRLLHLAEGMSALAFLLLDRFSTGISPDGLRVAADLALCTPALFLPFT